ncbi:MAG: peptide-methionine (S)-S-oxide reductase MsrA [Acidobacteria bacterium]|nr:peptide-methionine (S)-S-oxide reductase MsrA [Acidobacteriota bacterium]
MRKLIQRLMPAALGAVFAFQGVPAMSADFPDPKIDAPLVASKDKATAILAGGCFWCTEAVFEIMEGVEDVVSGYVGGTKETAKYDIVSTGRTGHAEAILITYNPGKVSYGQLLKIFFAVAHDPTTLNRQGNDIGPQYRSAIFYIDDEQKKIAEAYIAQLDAAKQFRNPIVTQVAKFDKFYTAEGYHQNYSANNKTGYVVAVSDPKVEKLKKQFPGCVRKRK